eukprot:TRINITY_DN9271_c0_g1_i1.p1 TRINITY_DN9271_c0_g1~~TRINITY_DN9271_c0_g1_i1.p1  ORF type:complete len:156 (-),score=15.59 TRINITY_DN9271_c0_g1_i1:93-560(-)
MSVRDVIPSSQHVEFSFPPCGLVAGEEKSDTLNFQNEDLLEKCIEGSFLSPGNDVIVLGFSGKYEQPNLQAIERKYSGDISTKPDHHYGDLLNKSPRSSVKESPKQYSTDDLHYRQTRLIRDSHLLKFHAENGIDDEYNETKGGFCGTKQMCNIF